VSDSLQHTNPGLEQLLSLFKNLKNNLECRIVVKSTLAMAYLDLNLESC